MGSMMSTMASRWNRGPSLAHYVGHGVADEHADGGGDEGQLEGAGEHHGVGAHFGEVIQRKAADQAAEKA